jgi:predicted phage terminase large subunit-like protein
VRFPAIAEDDESWALDAELGQSSFTRRRGEALHPERQPLETLERIRRVPGFIPGTANNPPGTSSRGSPANTSKPRRRRAAAWSRRPGSRLTGQTSGPRNSTWSSRAGTPPTRQASSPPPSLPRMRGREGGGCTTWGINGKDIYLLHVLRRRMEHPELRRAVREQCQAFDASVVLIEDKASGTQLIQELVAEGLHAVTRYQPQSDKIMRMHAQTAMIENGFVHLPKEAAWLAEYLHELTVFPKGKHDAQVDSTAQTLDWFKQASSGPTSNTGDLAPLQTAIRAPAGGPAHRPARTAIGDGKEARHPPAAMTTTEPGGLTHCEGISSSSVGKTPHTTCHTLGPSVRRAPLDP